MICGPFMVLASPVSRRGSSADVDRQDRRRILIEDDSVAADAEPEALIGYRYLVKHVTSTDRFLGLARKDLASIYDGLHRADEAARYRGELEMAAKH